MIKQFCLPGDVVATKPAGNSSLDVDALPRRGRDGIDVLYSLIGQTTITAIPWPALQSTIIPNGLLTMPCRLPCRQVGGCYLACRKDVCASGLEYHRDDEPPSSFPPFPIGISKAGSPGLLRITDTIISRPFNSCLRPWHHPRRTP